MRIDVLLYILQRLYEAAAYLNVGDKAGIWEQL